MEQKQIDLKEVLEGAKLGAEQAKAQADAMQRQQESELQDVTKVEETKLEDNTN